LVVAGQTDFYRSYLASFAVIYQSIRVLDVDEATAISYAAVRSELKRAGTPIPSNDAWIAAPRRQHSFSLLSRDRHFDLVRGIERVTGKRLGQPLFVVSVTRLLNSISVFSQHDYRDGELSCSFES
jgi:hypothetical protein